MRGGNRTAAGIGADELLRALNTLQNTSIGYEEELSFGQPHKQGQEHMHFEIYMQQKKQTGKGETHRGTKSKSVTPLKESTNFRRQNNTPRQALRPSNKVGLKVDKENLIKNSEEREGRMSSSKLSYQTRQILQQKKEQGRAYVPIHQRADELLRQREAKLVQLKREQEVSKLMEEKECTFKPKTNKHLPKAVRNHQESRQSKVDRSLVLEREMQKCQKTVQIRRGKPVDEGQRQRVSADNSFDRTVSEVQDSVADYPAQSMQPFIKKYKNDKFNPLLDLIH